MFCFVLLATPLQRSRPDRGNGTRQPTNNSRTAPITTVLPHRPKAAVDTRRGTGGGYGNSPAYREYSPQDDDMDSHTTLQMHSVAPPNTHNAQYPHHHQQQASYPHHPQQQYPHQRPGGGNSSSYTSVDMYGDGPDTPPLAAVAPAPLPAREKRTRDREQQQFSKDRDPQPEPTPSSRDKKDKKDKKSKKRESSATRGKETPTSSSKVSRSGSRSRSLATARVAGSGLMATLGSVGAVSVNMTALASKTSVATLTLLGIIVLAPTVMQMENIRDMLPSFPNPLFGSGSGSGSSSSSSGSSVLKGAKPNIILVFPDDMGYNDVGYTNPNVYKPFTTTNIDNLAKSGIIFSHYYTTPNCAPSRCAVLTGRYTLRNGCQNKDPDYAPWGLPLTEPFFPTVLKTAGYYNVMLGKWHIGMFTSSYLPTSRDFDEFVGFLGGGVDHFDHDGDDGGYDWWNGTTVDYSTVGIHSTAVLNSSMWTFMTHRAVKNQPWFLYIPVLSPHGPFEAPYEWRVQLKGKFDDVDSGDCAWAAMINMLDDFMGNIVVALKQFGMYERTMLIYAGDHGSEPNSVSYDGNKGRDYPFSGQKGQMWEGGVHVPAFVHAPFLSADLMGTIVTTVVSVYDWLPTVASMASVDVSPFPTMDGADLSSFLLKNENAPTRDHILISLNHMCQYDNKWEKPQAGIRVGDYKMIVDCVGNDGTFYGNTYLFDIVTDYTESTNYIKDNSFTGTNANLISYMKSLLAAYAKESVAGLTDGQPWQGNDYWCAKCNKGCATNGVWYPYYNDNGQYLGGQCQNNNRH